MLIALPIFVFLFGILIGSFLNVCITRIPQGESVVTPRSYCTHCRRKVRFYDNIPLLSFLILRGRCRDCHQAISWQYPLVECTAGFLALACFYRFPPLTHGLVWFLAFLCPLLVISFIDLRYLRIPNSITLPGIFIGLLAHPFLFPEKGFFNSFLESCLGVVLGGGSLWLIGKMHSKLRKREGLGAGDFKLAAMLGAYLGWRSIFMVLFLSSLGGVLAGLLFILTSRKRFDTPLPYGPFLALGGMAELFFSKELTKILMGLLR